MSKILFICEGEKTEKKFCNLIIDEYFIKRQKEKKYIAFNTNIYGLYDEMSKDNGLDLLQLIAEKAKIKGDMNNYNNIKSGGFSEVYLIFDFDPHDPKYSDEKIKKITNFFNNETTNGKLYINYPMFESFKHFKSIPDEEYNNYCISISECNSYKQIVANISAIPHFSDVNEEILTNIIHQNLKKYEKLTKLKIDTYNKYIFNFSQNNLLNIQFEFGKKNKVIVFNSSVFWGIDYFGEKIYDIYYKSN